MIRAAAVAVTAPGRPAHRENVEGFVALFSLGRAESKGLTIFFALISIIAGFTLHPLVLVFALSGSLMISRIRIPKL